MTTEERKIGNNGYQIPLGSGLRKIERNEGEKFDVAGARFTWKVKGEDTGYAFSIYEQELELGEGVPLHCHAYGEVFYVLSGYIDFLRVTGAGEEWITCAGGETIIIIPTNALHAFYNRTDRPARLLSISTQLHQAFFDAVEETDRANPFASMPGKHAMARIGMHFFPFSPPPPIPFKTSRSRRRKSADQQGKRTGPRRRFVQEADTISSRSATSAMTSRVG